MVYVWTSLAISEPLLVWIAITPVLVTAAITWLGRTTSTPARIFSVVFLVLSIACVGIRHLVYYLGD